MKGKYVLIGLSYIAFINHTSISNSKRKYVLVGLAYCIPVHHFHQPHNLCYCVETLLFALVGAICSKCKLNFFYRECTTSPWPANKTANASLPSFIASAPRYHHQRIKLSCFSTESVEYSTYSLWPYLVAQASSVSSIVDLTFRITTCRSLLAIAFRTWGLVCINLSFASREFVCARSTEFAHDLDLHCIRFCPSAWTPRFQRVVLCIASARTSLAVSAVAPS